MPASPQEYERSRRRSGQGSPYHHESPSEDDWDHPTTRSSSPANMPRTHSSSPANVPRTRSSSSAVPFDSFRVPTPPLRCNPDHRQRPVPMAQSMSKHYSRAHQLPVKGGRGNRIPETRPGRSGQQRPKYVKEPIQQYGDPRLGCYIK